MRTPHLAFFSPALRGLALAGLFAAAIPLSAAPASAANSAKDNCITQDISNELRVKSCSDVLKSRNVTNREQVVAYCNRGYSLTELGQYDRVIADYTQTISSILATTRLSPIAAPPITSGASSRARFPNTTSRSASSR